MISTADGAVGDLRRVAGGDLAVGLERRLELGQRLDGGAGRMPSSAVTTRRARRLLVARRPAPATISFSKRPSSVACAARCWLCGAEGVEVLAGEAPLVGDQLGRDALRHEAADRRRSGRRPSGRTGSRLAVGHRGAHRHAGHDLDAGGDDDVVGAGDHALGGEVGRLLRRAALAVDGGAGHRLGEAGGEHGVAADVERPARRPA